MISASKTTYGRMVYALRNGETVHVDETERGLACGCICPACGERLIAKKGPKMLHHFAHCSGTECEHGYETSLHQAAKEILSKSPKMMLPPAEILFPDSSKVVPITADPIELKIEKVELEKRIDTIVPDVVVSSAGKKLLVEIYVSHKVDDVKLAKIKALHLSAIEIDLRSIELAQAEEELNETIVNGIDRKTWLNNEYANKLRQQFYDAAENKPIIMRGFAIHVDDCPIGSRNWHGKPYANVMDDCSYCKYMVSDNHERILCTGRSRTATLEDFDLTMEERLKKEANQKEEQLLKKR